MGGGGAFVFWGGGGGPDGDFVAGLEFVAGHPDAAAVDEYDAVVEQLFGGAAGEVEGVGEVVEEVDAVAGDGGEGAQAGGVFLGGGGGAFHGALRRKGEKEVWVS